MLRHMTTVVIACGLLLVLHSMATAQGFNRIGISPRNNDVGSNYQYHYTRTLTAPYCQYPLNLIRLNFQSCPNTNAPTCSGSPKCVHPTSRSGCDYTWAPHVLDFGGTDACSVRLQAYHDAGFWVTVQTIPGYTPDCVRGSGSTSCGGVRSPDKNGDGYVSLSDLVAFQQCFIRIGPIFDCDCEMPFNDIGALSDLNWWRCHFTGGC